MGDGMRERVYRRKFPVLAFIILIFAVTWLLREMEIIDIRIPFLPVVLIVIALGIIFNRLIS
jgi:uncharacterized membrane protein YoaK (UPF0700 family)